MNFYTTAIRRAYVQPLSNDSYGLCAVLKYFPSKKRGVLEKTLRFLIQGTWFFSLKMRDKFYKNIFSQKSVFNPTL